MHNNSFTHFNVNKWNFSNIINNAAENILCIYYVYIIALLVYANSTSLEISILLSKIPIPSAEYECS